MCDCVPTPRVHVGAQQGGRKYVALMATALRVCVRMWTVSVSVYLIRRGKGEEQRARHATQAPILSHTITLGLTHATTTTATTHHCMIDG